MALHFLLITLKMIAIFADNIKDDCKLLKILKMIVLFADNIKDDDDS